MSGATEANVHAAPSMTLRQFALTIFFPIALCYFLSNVFRNINAVLAPYLTGEFALNATSLGALTASYLLAFAVMQVPLGLLIDRYGYGACSRSTCWWQGPARCCLRWRASSRRWPWHGE